MTASPTRTVTHDVIRDLLGDEAITVTINGNCMAPLIEHGARVQVKALKRYLPGDLVVVKSPAGAYLAHRVIGYARHKGRLQLYTRSDSAPRPDAGHDPAAVLGKIISGACRPQAINISVIHRLRALVHFGGFALVYGLRGRLTGRNTDSDVELGSGSTRQ